MRIKEAMRRLGQRVEPRALHLLGLVALVGVGIGLGALLAGGGAAQARSHAAVEVGSPEGHGAGAVAPDEGAVAVVESLEVDDATAEALTRSVAGSDAGDAKVDDGTAEALTRSVAGHAKVDPRGGAAPKRSGKPGEDRTAPVAELDQPVLANLAQPTLANLAPPALGTPAGEPCGAVAGPAGSPASRRGSASAGAVRGHVNLNTASRAELMRLPRVGAAKADRIIEWRERHGPFRRVKDLRRVKGFGRKSVDHLEPHLTVTGPTTLEKG